MDIARYIGLFLLKNNFCYVHGLGNLELRKKPASLEGQSLQSPQYEVRLTLGGSIDDNLANFIAVNEQISISKASNALRDFSIRARTELQEGREVVLPAIGKFVEENGRIQFITDPHLSYVPAAVPVVPMAKRIEEEKEQETTFTSAESGSRSHTTVNWGKIIIWVLILAIVAAAVVYGIRFIEEQQRSVAETEAVQPPLPEIMIEEPIAPASEDSTLVSEDTTMTPAPAESPASEDLAPEAAAQVAGPQISYQVVLNEYDNLPRAQKREAQLTSFGNTVTLITRDSASFYIVMPMKGVAADTARVVDSLKRLFNPNGNVRVYR
jgi:hypothetical protein